MDKKYKVLELFAGTAGISTAFYKAGLDIFTVDWDESFDVSLHCDIGTLTAQDIIDKFGIPDIIWMAPECTTYSLAAISKHRTKNDITGNLDPVSEYAKKCDEVNQNALKILEDFLVINPKLLFFIENPRACLQNMTWMKKYDKYKYVITYCKYMLDMPAEQRPMKPTNIWTNHPNPNFLPPSKIGEPDHAKAPRGSRNGVQGQKNAKERSKYPPNLINHIVDISLQYLEDNDI